MNSRLGMLYVFICAYIYICMCVYMNVTIIIKDKEGISLKVEVLGGPEGRNGKGESNVILLQLNMYF